MPDAGGRPFRGREPAGRRQRHPALARLVESRRDAAAFVIACYSDPGIDACRAATAVPVLGIQESGILTALARGERVGVVAIAEASIPRHRRYLRRMGVEERVVSGRALGLSVDETARGSGTFERLVGVGRVLVGDGADVIVLGCAGMARHQEPLERELRAPVIDPVRAAVAMALGAVLSGRQAGLSQTRLRCSASARCRPGARPVVNRRSTAWPKCVDQAQRRRRGSAGGPKWNA